MLLKWTKTELLNITDSTVMFDEYLTFERESFKDIKRLIGLEDVHVSGEGYYDPHTDLFDVDMPAYIRTEHRMIQVLFV